MGQVKNGRVSGRHPEVMNGVEDSEGVEVEEGNQPVAARSRFALVAQLWVTAVEIPDQQHRLIGGQHFFKLRDHLLNNSHTRAQVHAPHSHSHPQHNQLRPNNHRSINRLEREKNTTRGCSIQNNIRINAVYVTEMEEIF